MAAHTAGHAETQLVIAGPSLQAGPASEQVARLESDGAEAAAGGVAITAAASMANSSLIKAQR